MRKRSLLIHEDPQSFLGDPNLLWHEPVRHLRRFKRDFISNDIQSNNLLQQDNLSSASRVPWKIQSKLASSSSFDDPDWNNGRTWYLTRPEGGTMRVQGAWNMGYFGQGVVVTILDDGVESNHTELSSNFDPLASYDINGGDPDPMPR